MKTNQFIFLAILIGVLHLSLGCSKNDSSHDGSQIQAVAQSASGELVVARVDYMDQGRSDLIYQLRQPSSGGAVTNLTFDGVSTDGLKTGDFLTVHGESHDGQFTVHQFDVGMRQQGSTEQSIGGEQKTLIVPLSFSDASIECGAAQMQADVFGSTNSTNDFYRQNSNNQIWFDGSVSPPVKLNMTATTSCDYEAWGNAADSALAAKGIITSQYNHVVYALPQATGCGWAGLGYISGPRVWNKYCDDKRIYSHELGHNLGMAHAGGNGQEYGDYSDVMGMALCMLNAPHKEQMGWVTGADQQISSDGTFTIGDLESTSSSGTQIIKFAKPDTGDFYYVSYRVPVGIYDQSLSGTYANRVNIHEGSSSLNTHTFFLGSVGDGESFNDAKNNISVTGISHTGTTATFKVSFSGGGGPTQPPVACARAAPALTLSPVSQTGQQGQTLAYSLTVLNQDSAACPSSSFGVGGSVPAGLTGTVSNASTTLQPGQAAALSLSLTSSQGAASGNYPFNVSVSDASQPVHSANANGIYVVVAPPPPPTLGTPSGLVVSLNAAKQIQMAWNGSQGATGYLVVRNGSVLAQTAATSYLDATVRSGLTYSYSIVAVGQNGQQSGGSNSVSIAVPGSGRHRAVRH